MIKPAFKALSLSFVLFSAAGVALASEPVTRAVPLSPCEIDRGWEQQQKLVDERVAARAAQGLAVPGAIILPPLPDFAPSRAGALADAQSRKPLATEKVGRTRPATRN